MKGRTIKDIEGQMVRAYLSGDKNEKLKLLEDMKSFETEAVNFYKTKYQTNQKDKK
jgi:hypothetical protein